MWVKADPDRHREKKLRQEALEVALEGAPTKYANSLQPFIHIWGDAMAGKPAAVALWKKYEAARALANLIK